jgi:hypothetical protein
LQCQDYEGVSILHANANLITEHIREVTQLLDYCGLEYSEITEQTLQIDADGTTITCLRDPTANCETTVESLNEIVNKFTMGVRPGNFFCSLEGEFITDAGACAEDAAMLNAAVFEAQNDKFKECARTTETTTPTSTVTSSVTTTPTTTPVNGKFSCFTYAKQNYLVVTGDEKTCNQQADIVNSALDACELALEGSERTDDALSCTEVTGVHILYDGSSACPESASAIEAMLDAYKERDYGDITCSPSGAYRVGGSCALVAQTLNDLLNSYVDGTFATCSLSTPTTSQTTTATSTITSTGTTTFTSTQTTSFTSSQTTTMTSTGTSSATTSATTSITTTGTSSVTSSAVSSCERCAGL